MSPDEPAWERLEIDPRSATFPAAASVAGEPIWVFHLSDGFRGVQAMCPHEQRSLGEARLVGDQKMLRCAYHNYTFKLANGSGVNCPGFRISVYQIKEEDGGLFAQPVPAS
jgi:nitrite reductase/ring-hydroxylating ferredoxin subunit